MYRIFASCLLILFAVSCGKKKPPEPKFAIVYFAKGDVKTENSGALSPVSSGDRLDSGMTLITGKDGNVDILLPNESIVRIKPNSKLKINVELWEPSLNKTKLQMFGGRIFVQVNQKLAKGEEFKIHTTTQVAGVRGTSFAVTDEQTSTQVAVIEGSVAVTAGDQEQVVDSGNKSEGSEASIEVSELTDAEKKELMGESDSIKQIAKDQIQNIWEEFEKGKAEIRKDLDTQKEINKQTIDEQKEKNKALIDETKSKSKSEMNDVINKTKQDGNDAKSELEKLKNQLKNP